MNLDFNGQSQQLNNPDLNGNNLHENGSAYQTPFFEDQPSDLKLFINKKKTSTLHETKNGFSNSNYAAYSKDDFQNESIKNSYQDVSESIQELEGNFILPFQTKWIIEFIYKNKTVYK